MFNPALSLQSLGATLYLLLHAALRLNLRLSSRLDFCPTAGLFYSLPGHSLLPSNFSLSGLRRLLLGELSLRKCSLLRFRGPLPLHLKALGLRCFLLSKNSTLLLRHLLLRKSTPLRFRGPLPLHLKALGLRCFLLSKNSTLLLRRLLLCKSTLLRFHGPLVLIGEIRQVAPYARSQFSTCIAGVQGLPDYGQFLLGLLNLPTCFDPLLRLYFPVLNTTFRYRDSLGRSAQTLLGPDPAALPFFCKVFSSLRSSFRILSPLLVIA